jgi:hypothetical protein
VDSVTGGVYTFGAGRACFIEVEENNRFDLSQCNGLHLVDMASVISEIPTIATIRRFERGRRLGTRKY